MTTTSFKHPMNPCHHDVADPNAPLVNVQLDGEWVQVPRGLNVVEVTRRFGKFIPHYCYHPKLPVVGNCRMCLFEMGTPKLNSERKPILDAEGKPEIAWMPRPQIGCATTVTEGMGIRTSSPLAQECRKSVMEFLLINHPLDCPICDQAGECKLQEYSVEYGKGESRFVEEKVHKPKRVDLGERIILDDERCILCSRCIRFSKDVMQDDVLGFVDRGSYSTLTAHPDKPFDNEYSLNTVDICPVGALTSKDFRFQMRVWFLKETPSFCTSCGTGCNITIGSRQDKVYRLTPRSNEEVNSEWMCDFGRLNFHYLENPSRLKSHTVRIGEKRFPLLLSEAYQQIAERLRAFKPEEIAILASARMTNEELYILRLLADELGVRLVDIVPRSWAGDKFLKSSDQNPNSQGARLLGLSQNGEKIQSIASGIEKGSIQVLLSFQEDAAAAGISLEALSKLKLLVYVGILDNPTAERADYTLASAGFTEKKGSMINVHDRLQRLSRAVLPPAGVADDWEILQGLREATSKIRPFPSIEETFEAMAARYAPLSGLTFHEIGHAGIPLKLV